MLYLQEGTRVKVDFSAIKGESYSLPSKAVSTKMYKGVMSEDGSVLFDKNIGGWGMESRNWHVPKEAIKIIKEKDKGIIVMESLIKNFGFTEDYMIPVSSMMRIREVACGSWQQRISDLICNSGKDFSCTKEFAEEMISASNDAQKTVVLEILRNAGYKVKAEVKKLDYKDYFDFSDNERADAAYKINTQTDQPMYLRNGLATHNMEYREIGFGSSHIPVLVKENGDEVELTGGEYLKFISK